MSEHQSKASTQEVKAEQLPLHCPMDESSAWSSHPRVFLPFDKEGHARCPYCGAEYVLKGDVGGHH
ncbi:MAG: zinc-finger domain-containing protein [Gammaproteobacteria bacterium]|nr:zinc-finger domain-containing protein [Gammaproteobacteria bacterium]MDH5694329.1 zinc-finger domain-containing protein [Gammaproteobacteria bacterium]